MTEERGERGAAVTDDVSTELASTRSRRRIGMRVAKVLIVVVAVIIGLAATDSLLGLGYHTSTASDIHLTHSRSGNDPQRTIVVFPGFIMAGDVLSRALAPHLEPTDSMLVVEYAQRGVDMDDIYHRVMAQLEDLRPDHLVLYGASMGGMCAKEFLDRYSRDRKPFGEAVLILDTAPSSAANVKRSPVYFGSLRGIEAARYRVLSGQA